jgi:cytoskeletal protein RodZ
MKNTYRSQQGQELNPTPSKDEYWQDADRLPETDLFPKRTSSFSPTDEKIKSPSHSSSLLNRLDYWKRSRLNPRALFKRKLQSNPQEKQREKLKELGSRLHQLRIEKGMSIERISKRTLIPSRLLKAIESGNLEALPEPIYIRGLIKQFADVMGLDGAELTKDFPTDLKNLETVQATYFWGRLPNFNLRPFHLYILYILLVMLSVRGLSNWLKHYAMEIGALDSPQPSVVQSSPVRNPASKPAKPIPVAQKPLAKAVVVDIKLQDECWLKVIVDGKTEFEGLLPEGTHRTWKANKRLTIRAGNAGRVLVAFNDQQAKQLGKPGQVQEITFQTTPRS